MPPRPPRPGPLSLVDVAIYLSVGESTGKRWAEDGNFPPAKRQGKRWAVLPEDLAAWLASRYRGGPAPPPRRSPPPTAPGGCARRWWLRAMSSGASG